MNTRVLRVSSGAVFSPRTPDLQYLRNSEHRYVTALATYFSQGAKVQIEIKIIKLIDTIVEKNTAGCIFIPSIGSGLKADDDCCAWLLAGPPLSPNHGLRPAPMKDFSRWKGR